MREANLICTIPTRCSLQLTHAFCPATARFFSPADSSLVKRKKIRATLEPRANFSPRRANCAISAVPPGPPQVTIYNSYGVVQFGTLKLPATPFFTQAGGAGKPQRARFLRRCSCVMGLNP